MFYFVFVVVASSFYFVLSILLLYQTYIHISYIALYISCANTKARVMLPSPAVVMSVWGGMKRLVIPDNLPVCRQTHR